MSHRRWLLVVLLGSLACKREAPSDSAEPAPKAKASAEPAPKKRPKAKVALPPFSAPNEGKPQELTFAGKDVKLVICKLDEAAPPMVDKDWWFHALSGLAVAKDGSVYVVDHENKLRKYQNQSKDGCELALDPEFGKAGVMDFASPRSSVINGVTVDSKDAVYFSWNKAPQKIVGGKAEDFCSGWVRADPYSPLMVVDGNVGTTGDCKGKYAKGLLTGFDPTVPQYDDPKVVGLYGDELVSHGVDLVKGKSVHKVGLHSLDGKRRLVLGGHEDDAMYSIKDATRCGDDLCVLDAPLSSAALLRWTKDGKFLGKLKLSSDANLSIEGDRIGWSKAGLYLGGASRGEKSQWVGVIGLITGV